MISSLDLSRTDWTELKNEGQQTDGLLPFILNAELQLFGQTGLSSFIVRADFVSNICVHIFQCPSVPQVFQNAYYIGAYVVIEFAQAAA
jgi:hypothetical protein